MNRTKGFQKWGDPIFSCDDFHIIVNKDDGHGVAVYWREDFPRVKHDENWFLTPLLIPRKLGIAMLKGALSETQSKVDAEKIEKAIRELSE